MDVRCKCAYPSADLSRALQPERRAIQNRRTDCSAAVIDKLIN
jgi:hypothetical protein